LDILEEEPPGPLYLDSYTCRCKQTCTPKSIIQALTLNINFNHYRYL
jgi:hypothetical protein